MVDATKRQLKVPARFVPYMEKHRIYELFSEIARDIVLKLPSDQILHMKQTLRHIAIARDKPRVLLIAPAHVDTKSIGKMIATNHNIPFVSCEEAKSYTEKGCGLVSHLLAESASIFDNNCWVLVDGPSTVEEAASLQRAGILPSHTFQLIPALVQDHEAAVDPLKTCTKTVSDLDLSSVLERALSDLSSSETEKQNYERYLNGLRDLFQTTLREVQMKDKTLEEVAIECTRLSSSSKHYRAPMLPRVLMLGLTGSGVSTQATMLSKRFNLVHVDLERLLATTRLQVKDRHAHLLQTFQRDGIRISPQVMLSIVEKRLLRADCLAQGWIITGYPRDLTDFELFDTMDTPPNRVIVFEVSQAECIKRLKARRYNIHTGSEHKIPQHTPESCISKSLKAHPVDAANVQRTSLDDQCVCLKEMKDYAKTSAEYINGERDVHSVFEMVSAVVMRPAPVAPPRRKTQTQANSG